MVKFKIPYKAGFIISGIASTAWFLIRVIPKPSRASYPCMRAASPVMSAFIIYLIALSGSVMVFRRAKTHLTRSKYIAAGGLFLIAISLFAFATNLNLKTIYAQIKSANSTKIVPNLPFGEPRGIFPGRVVWAWNPDATDINCTNNLNDPIRGADGYFLAKNNNQVVVDSMLNDAIRKLTGASSVKNAWTALFKSFNERKGLGSVEYVPGQKIFIKVNLGGGSWLTNSNDLSLISLPWAAGYYGLAETSPAIMIALLKQLVTIYGVQQKDIYLGDPIAHIYKHVYEQLRAVFPDVKYVDKDHSNIGRTKLTIPAAPVIFYSDKGTVMPSAVSDKIYTEMQDAGYLINIAALKAHARNGVTLNTKNHFGSQTRAGADHLHNGLIAPENDQPIRTEYRNYRVLTDLMGHEKLGGNTLLFMIDGLWGGTEAVEKPVKWNMAPFNGDWPNSIFIAQDPVAIESVCMDFLRSEFTDPNGPGKARPQFGAVDDYLLQAADSSFWPEGIRYDPENDGTIMRSLGICEHWNDSGKKQYSHNLGYNKGIELMSTSPELVKTTVIAIKTETPPTFDGEENDICWTEAKWYPIDQTWIIWGQKIDSSDFHGEFKISWSSADNLMYFLVKVTDDAFIDGYVYPGDGYPNFDIVEVFIDEDKSGGLHVFDNNPTLGQNAENAFSYHMATSQPADGEISTDLVACDISGTDWGNSVIENYASHFPDFKMRRNGNVYTYEFSMKVYSDTYLKSNPENSRVTLAENKLMGMSLAYCDNDDPDGVRDNFFGSVWVPETEYNDHWMNANGFGSIRLVTSISGLNHPVVTIAEIPDINIREKNETLTIVEDLSSHFFDPDQDTLSYHVQSASGNLVFGTVGNKLTVIADNEYAGDVLATITATDGQYEASLNFMIFDETSGIVNNSLSGKITIYPNPASEILFLTLPSKIHNQSIKVEVYSLNGVRVISENLNYSEPDELIHLNVCHLITGSYLIRINAGNENFTERFYKK
ncbi:MAG: DUF362 domain-containing protein [Porphyromonadaceae bacterium]|nr:MAG: DUF362 domain-containing protein [Porphyromonadaceae bacterium]